MGVPELTLLVATALLTAALTAVVGFGGGTVLLGVLLLFMPPAVAIPFHGMVQLVSNAWRLWLFRRHIAWYLLWRFALLLPVGVALGLWLFRGLSKEAIQLLIGLFILTTLYMRQLKRFRHRDLPLWGFFPLGFVTGVLNIMVGVVSPLLGVLTVRRELPKEGLIATLAGFAMAGHVLKIGGFGLLGFPFGAYLLPFALMVPALLLGGVLGKWALARVNEQVFAVLFYGLIALLALKLILWDALWHGYLA